MKVVDGFEDASVNVVIDAASESNDDSIVRDGRHIRGCNMMKVIDPGRGGMGEEVR